MPSRLVHLLLQLFNEVWLAIDGFLIQDSQEFMRCLLDRLHEELKQEFPHRERPKSTKQQTNQIKLEQTLHISQILDQEHHIDNGNKQSEMHTQKPGQSSSPSPPRSLSIISRIFQGTLLSRVKCLNCNKVPPFSWIFNL